MNKLMHFVFIYKRDILETSHCLRNIIIVNF